MSHQQQFYIDGAWVAPRDPEISGRHRPVERGRVREDRHGLESGRRQGRRRGQARVLDLRLDQPGSAARAPAPDRRVYKKRSDDLALAVSREMGAPRGFALKEQVGIGLAHLEEMVGTLETFEFERLKKDPWSSRSRSASWA